MSAAAWVLGGAVVALVALSGVQIALAARSRRSVGAEAAPVGGAAVEDGLVYFYSPTCGPCRAMSPAVHALKAAGKPVHAVDVTRDPATAGAYGVMATPTTVAVRAGRVVDVKLGVLSPAHLAAMLDPRRVGSNVP